MSMHRMVFLGAAVAMALNAQHNYYVPEVVDGNTVAHSERARARTRVFSVRTTFVLVNTGKTDANVTIAAIRADGTPRALTISGLGSGTSLSTKLPAGATRMFATDGSGDGSAGVAVVSSDVPIDVSQILSNTKSGEPISESAVSTIADEELADEYMIPVDASGGSDTGIALYNPGAESAAITVKLLDGVGAANKTATLTLGAQRRTTIFATDPLLEAPPGFRGTMHIASTANLAAVTVRRSSFSPAYTLLPAAKRMSHHVRFFLPGIADGQRTGAVTQTTFLLTNLSAAAAAVKLKLTRDDGTPFQVGLGGAASGNVFQSTIAAGATLFWQTGGTRTALTSGAAVITSDQPLGVSAVISTSDSSGSVSETGLTPALNYFQFVLPFDDSSKTQAGVTIYNSGAKPVPLTLQLNTPDGKSLASKQLSPLPGGAAVTETLADLFPGVSATSGAITVSTGSPLNTLASALSIRQSTQGVTLSSAPAAELFSTGSGTPTTVVPALDMANQATATMPSTGGSLSVTDAKGNRFTLTIPPGALFDRTDITMTPSVVDANVDILVNGIQAKIQFQGLAPGFAGLYQVNFNVPSGVTAQTLVYVTIQTLGASTSQARIYIM